MKGRFEYRVSELEKSFRPGMKLTICIFIDGACRDCGRPESEAMHERGPGIVNLMGLQPGFNGLAGAIAHGR
ncbi:MAG: hypothetical protein WD944_06485 [Steroidobacteraceae bacterium]